MNGMGLRVAPIFDAAVIGWLASVAYGGWWALAILPVWLVISAVLDNKAIS